MRVIYYCLVQMHPPAFRNRFGDEMMLIFEDAPQDASLALLADALFSALRQWLLSPATLTVAGALVFGLIPVLIGMACTGVWPLQFGIR